MVKENFIEKKKLLKRFISLTDQAEKINSYDSYKEVIETFRSLNYHDLFYLMNDTEEALKVLLRGEAEGESTGIVEIVKDIVEYGLRYLSKKKWVKLEDIITSKVVELQPKTNISLRYTYEFIEERENKK